MLREWTVENGSDYVIAGFCQREKKKKKKKKRSQTNFQDLFSYWQNSLLHYTRKKKKQLLNSMIKIQHVCKEIKLRATC